MDILSSRQHQGDNIGNITYYGIIGLLSGFFSLIFLIISFSSWVESREPVYYFAYPDQVGETRNLSDLFEIPVSRTTYSQNLPYKDLLEQSEIFYFTSDCQMPNMPEMISFRPGSIYRPRNIYITMNLREARSNINGVDIKGKTIGHVVLEFATENTGERFYYLELIAGKNIREWLIGAKDEGIEVIDSISSFSAQEGYKGKTRQSGLDGVIDIITFNVPYDVPDKPLIGVWILDQSKMYLNNCDPGIQVMNIVIEAPRGLNEKD